MRYTIYKTPVVKQFFRGLSWLGLKLTGWKMVGTPPTEKKYVLIAAPHTSNWDFPLTLAMAFILDFEIYWMGKDSLFRGPMGPVMKWLGGIPIDRSKANNVVQSTVDSFNAHDELIVLVPPEGTRSKVTYWKTGFYRIAVGANVPLALGFVDFATKTGGFGPTYYPSGDIEKDMPEIQAFYKNKKGKSEDMTSEL